VETSYTASDPKPNQEEGMKRRDFLKKAAVGVAASSVFGNVYVHAQQRVRWRCATSWPRSLDTIFGGAEDVAERVKAMTNGAFEIQPFPAGELAPALGILDAVQQGSVECGHTASYYYVGKNPSLAFATSVPFGLNAQQQNAWLYSGGGLETIQKVMDDFKIINWPAGNTGAQMGGWFKKEVKTAADLRGLKFRIPGLGGQVMARLGANVQNIPGGEIFLALDRGAIDAAEWVGPYDDEKLGLNRAARFYYYPGWWEPGPTLDLMINVDQWKRLPKEFQEALKSACAEANIAMLAKYDAKNGPAFERISKSNALRPYSREILAAAEKASIELFEEIAAKDATYKSVFAGWSRFRDSIRRFHRVNEDGFANFVYSAR
jgi:TRAP-type mannitol/chloroaromatic compound transport system substrate-binding protein